MTKKESQRGTTAYLISLVESQEFIHRSDLLVALRDGVVRLKTLGNSQDCRQYHGIYGSRLELAKRRKTRPELIPAMEELVQRLRDSPDAPCTLWIIDTGDNEFVLFLNVERGIVAGCLHFDRCQLPGNRICLKCKEIFRSSPPFECRKCGTVSVPDSWKYREAVQWHKMRVPIWQADSPVGRLSGYEKTDSKGQGKLELFSLIPQIESAINLAQQHGIKSNDATLRRIGIDKWDEACKGVDALDLTIGNSCGTIAQVRIFADLIMQWEETLVDTKFD